jgi:hypothetical protein
MTEKKKIKLVHEGRYAAEVEVTILQTDTDWSPYLSMEDAYKLDDVRNALRRGDLETASRLAKVYTLTPMTLSDNSHPTP